GNYNYQGDIRQIAKGLQEDVARLAKESLDAGGDGQVDIVGFSLGGQIIREYLAQMVRSMETEEDDRPHHIANAIIIASPNKGSWAYAQSQKIPWPAGAISNQAANAYFAWSADNGQPINATAAALEQLKPDSSFMERVANRYATNVSYSTLYGDISGTVKQNLFGVQLGGKTSIGDTLLTADSASDIPNINEESYSFDSDVDVNVKIDIGNSSVAAELEFPTPMDYWKWQHRDLIEQPEIHQKVLEILEGV
ncbi:alpha/beta hydrolase, partial [Patescibacteria group bacterium]|nr:alpha/beta hydrolase [Patescibacteria group bacterium]